MKAVEGDRGRDDGAGWGEETGTGGEGEEIDPWETAFVEKGFEAGFALILCGTVDCKEVPSRDRGNLGGLKSGRGGEDDTS